jgi:hypothetical protein
MSSSFRSISESVAAIVSGIELALFLEQVGEPMGLADWEINEGEEATVDVLLARKEGVGDPGTINGKFGSMSARSVGVGRLPMVPISHVVH